MALHYPFAANGSTRAVQPTDRGICREEERICRCGDACRDAGVRGERGPRRVAAGIAAHEGGGARRRFGPVVARPAIGQELGDAPAVVAGSASQAQTQQQELQAPDGIPGDFFGETVSLTADGHTALVGAPFRRVGAAYVFAEQGGKWRLEQELESPAGSATDTYGYSVALSGDGSTALVGAYGGGSTENGVVYSYALQEGRYVLNGQITAPDGAPGDEFGASVSLSGLGNVALIGAPTHNGYEGAAYAFVHGARSWSLEREFINPGVAGSAYGLSVSEAPDGLAGVVGAPLGNDVQGAAYVVSELTGSQQELVASDAAEGSFFGISVSMNALGTRVLVGSAVRQLGRRRGPRLRLLQEYVDPVPRARPVEPGWLGRIRLLGRARLSR